MATAWRKKKKKTKENRSSCCGHMSNREQSSLVLSDLSQAVVMGDLSIIGIDL